MHGNLIYWVTMGTRNKFFHHGGVFGKQYKNVLNHG